MLRILAAVLALGLAMHLRYATELLAWSDDGTAALLRTRVLGPEGGSSESIRVVDLAAGQELSATVADDLSDDSGPRDHLDRARCRTELEAMAPALTHFRGLSVDAAHCKLVVGAPARGEALTVEPSGGWLLVKKGADTVAHAPGAPADSLRAFASPNGRAVLLFDADDRVIRGAWLGRGQLLDLQPVHKR